MVVDAEVENTPVDAANVVVVALSVSILVNLDVDDACRPDWNQIGVFVAFDVAP